MSKTFRCLASATALALAALSVPAQATVIDFESPDLTGLYFSGDEFSQDGYTFTQAFDAATIDIARGLGAAAPTNNATQFYSNQNDGYLAMTRTDGSAFSLAGFSAAFVPLIGSVSPPRTLGIVAVAFPTMGDPFGFIFGLGDTSSVTHGSPFLTFAGATFAEFTDIYAVQFYTCVIDSSVCDTPTRNNGQFALDNIVVNAVAAPVPEPETLALMAAGLFVVSFAARRRRNR